MRLEVVLTHDAERDLEEIYDFIAEANSQKNAEHASRGFSRLPIRCLFIPSGDPHHKSCVRWECTSTGKYFSGPTESYPECRVSESSSI